MGPLAVLTNTDELKEPEKKEAKWMADQEFLASYAVDIDEDGIERLESVLESNRSLAESLSEAFQQAYTDLTAFVQEAVNSVSSLESFVSAQQAAADTASAAEQAIAALTEAYAGLTAAIPDETLDLSFGEGTERNETGRKTSEFTGYLSDISSSLSRFVLLTAGTDNDGGDNGSGSGSGAGGETELSLNLAGASESLQTFLEDIASSEVEIPAKLDLSDLESDMPELEDIPVDLDFSESAETLQNLPVSLDISGAEEQLQDMPVSLDISGAEETLSDLETEISEADPTMPLKLDRTKADATLVDLKQTIADPVSLNADASAVLSAASSALATIKSQYANTTLQLKAVVTVVEKNGGSGGGGDDSGSGSGGDNSSGGSGSGSGSDGNQPNLMMSTGGRFTRPTKVEVAEDSDTEYIIPVEKESTAVPLIRQMLSELSDSARDSLSSSFSATESDENDKTGFSADSSEISIPEIQMPDVQVPDIQMPELSMPDVEIPDIQVSDFAFPDLSEMAGKQDSFSSGAMEALSALPSLLSAAPAASGDVSISNTDNRSVEAPVNITVNANGSDAELMGRTIYDSAQRYLAKTLAGAWA